MKLLQYRYPFGGHMILPVITALCWLLTYYTDADSDPLSIIRKTNIPNPLPPHDGSEK